jgi:23S rRNA pseudouridine1911/1915/1917 synthase
MAFQAGDEWTCGPEEVGSRLDKFLGARAPEVSRSRIQKWLEEGRFVLNGKLARKNDFLNEGDKVGVVAGAAVEPVRLEPEDIPLHVVHEDSQVLVIDKPKGMVTHPGNGIFSGTLANALAFRFKKLSDVNGPLRPGIIHRLDKDTSGLLVVAKNNKAHLNLAKQMDARDIRRVYHALVWREMTEASGTVDAPISRSLSDRLKMAVHADGKRAVTHYKVMAFYQFTSYLEVTLETGRTHQIRVHMAHQGFPVVGDPLYGGRQGMLGRVQPMLHPYAAKLLSFFPSQALHAHKLSFLHPVSGKRLEFSSPLPPEMIEALAFLEQFKHE